jgi:hypothetical protein
MLAVKGVQMNPSEQHERRTQLEKVDQRIDTLAEAVDAEVTEQMQKTRELVARLIAAEHEDRVSVMRADRLMAGRNRLAIVALNFYTSQFFAMNLRERFRWLVLGRMPAHISEFTEDPESVVLPSADVVSDYVSTV